MSMHEECGVVGVFRAQGGAAAIAHRALFALQHRGQQAAGIAVCDQKDIRSLRGRGLVTEAIPLDRVEGLEGTRAIGHVRYSTVPFDQPANIQPFIATTPFGPFALAHNGNIKNADELARTLQAQGAILSTSMDTELLVHLIARSGAASLEVALRQMAAQAQGAYALTMLQNGRLLALRDPFGVRPLVFGQREDQTLVVASETCALDAVGARTQGEVAPGELLELGIEGPRRVALLEPAPRAPCVFELVYFSRPNSVTFGQSVHAARTRMGEALARQDHDLGGYVGDVVIPVPDSGVPAAIGYARASGIPFELGIIRSHYVGRTFILPDQDSRTHQVRLKLSVIAEVVRGRRVVLIDDSIVRGNTARMIVEMLREAGAEKVLMRVASPPVAWPCYLGIDTPSREELVVNQAGSAEAVGRTIGVDELRYLALDGLKRAVGGTSPASHGSFCFGCLNGQYPV